MGLRESKKGQTRSQLLDAALALIAKQGYQQTTVNEIAAAVNVSPRTFLRYFPTKDDVVVGWLDEIMNVLPTALSDTAASAPPVEALMRAARKMLATYQAKGPFLHRIEDIVATSTNLRMRKQQRIEALVTDVSEALEAAYGARYSPLILDVYAGATVALCRATIREWLSKGGKGDILPTFERAAEVLRLKKPVQ